ncbi:MAG: hypothetical protein BWY31_01322 [Lentisphaerae bacterium ADurb.Bin242]|nr:MAG: hypothetical protein BWY31_01322 [Lentisphaerae bacterium ADurb.Bin242]
MSGKTTLLVFILLFCILFPLRSAEPKRTPEPAQTPSAYDRTRMEVDSVLQRVRAKISYSWMRSNEYFRQMVASFEEKAAADTRKVRIKTSAQSEELKKKLNQSKTELGWKAYDMYRKSDAVADEISRKTAKVKEEIEEMGKEFYKEASKEVEKNVDSLRK